MPVQDSSLPLLRYPVSLRCSRCACLAASACSCACGRCLRITLGPGAGFPFVSLPCGGSSDGSVPGDRFLSPGRMCLIHFVPVEFSRFGAVSIGELAFLPPLDLSVLLSDPVAPSLEETFEVPMRVGSSSSLLGLSSD